MGVLVKNTYKGTIGPSTTFEVAAKLEPWLARVAADVDSYVKAGKFGTKESGSIVFAAVADITTDSVTIFDGINTTVFNFVTTGDGATGATVTVSIGASATDSATNLRAAINANLNINVTAGGATTTVSVVNDNYTGGSITKVDADNDYVVTNFSGGVAGAVATVNDYPLFVAQVDGAREFDVGAGDGLSVRGKTAGNVWVSEIQKAGRV